MAAHLLHRQSFMMLYTGNVLQAVKTNRSQRSPEKVVRHSTRGYDWRGKRNKWDTAKITSADVVAHNLWHLQQLPSSQHLPLKARYAFDNLSISNMEARQKTYSKLQPVFCTTIGRSSPIGRTDLMKQPSSGQIYCAAHCRGLRMALASHGKSQNRWRPKQPHGKIHACVFLGQHLYENQNAWYFPKSR